METTYICRFERKYLIGGEEKKEGFLSPSHSPSMMGGEERSTPTTAVII